jgi:hypothetical protein
MVALRGKLGNTKQFAYIVLYDSPSQQIILVYSLTRQAHNSLPLQTRISNMKSKDQLLDSFLKGKTGAGRPSGSENDPTRPKDFLKKVALKNYKKSH